ncbi:MAG: hypothetical protein KDC49_20320 [Saprospiraceae bacterium]|nr:hypothetical protein [Saprospiraceae bacterium]
MKTNPREILLYYNEDSSSDRKTLAMAQSISRHIKSYDFKRSSNSPTGWQFILNNLNIHPKLLFNKAHPEYQKNIRGKEFGTEDWINILSNNPHLMKAPIAIKGNQVVLVGTPTDIYRLL